MMSIAQRLRNEGIQRDKASGSCAEEVSIISHAYLSSIAVLKSKFDQDVAHIKDLLGLSLSIRKASKILGYPNHIGLTNYIRTRQILAELKRND